MNTVLCGYFGCKLARQGGTRGPFSSQQYLLIFACFNFIKYKQKGYKNLTNHLERYQKMERAVMVTYDTKADD